MKTTKTVRLTATLSIEVGSIVDIEAHPSGSKYDGPARIVSAFLGTLGRPMISVVSLADPTGRIVHRTI